MKRISWFFATIFIGLIPFFIRLFVYYFILSDEKSLHFLLNETEFIFLGLIINLANLKELKNINLSAKNLGDTITKENIWIIISILITLFCIIVYSGIILLSYLGNMGYEFNLFLLKIITITLSGISIIFGFFIIGRANNIGNQILLSTRK